MNRQTLVVNIYNYYICEIWTKSNFISRRIELSAPVPSLPLPHSFTLEVGSVVLHLSVARLIYLALCRHIRIVNL